MASNGNGGSRRRRFSEEGKTESKSFEEDPYARTSPLRTSPDNKTTGNDSPGNSEELNPPPPIKIPPRSISAVESRLLNLATKERPSYRRSRVDDSSSDNDSPDKKQKTKSPPRRSSRSPRRRRSPSPRRRRSPSPRRSRSRSPKRKTRSPDRRRGRSPAKKRSGSPVKKNVRSPKQRSRSPTKSKQRSRSPTKGKRSPSNDKRRSRSRSTGKPRRRRSSTRSPPRRKQSRSPKRRSRSKSNNRRRSRSKSHGRRRSRSKSRDRRNGSRRRHSRSRSRSPKFTSKWGQRPSSGICRAVLPANGDDKRTREVTTEDVEKRLAQHMKAVQEQAAEEAKKINLPGYLNPAMVNVHQFKQVQDKRKLLWGKTKEEKGTNWSGAFGDTDDDGKFRRLMGIHETGAEGTSKTIEQSRRVLDDLEKEYEKSRAFQLSRGAGGLTGMGLGFGSGVQPQQ